MGELKVEWADQGDLFCSKESAVLSRDEHTLVPVIRLDAVDQVLAEAVWAMEIAKDAMECGVAPGDLTYDIDHKRVRDFLASPLVTGWRARQEREERR